MKSASLILILLLSGICAVATAEPICQFLPITDLVKQSMAAKGQTITDMENALPSSQEIGIPIYPGVFCGVTGESNGVLSTLTLVSKDSPEKVVAWYQKQLAKGWQYTPDLAIAEAGQVGVFINTDKKKVTAMDSLKYRQFNVTKVDKPEDTGFVGMMFKVDGIKSMITMTLKPLM